MQYHIDQPDAFSAWHTLKLAIAQLGDACRTIEPPHSAYEALGSLLKVRDDMQRHLGSDLIQSWEDEYQRWRSNQSDLDMVMLRIQDRLND